MLCCLENLGNLLTTICATLDREEVMLFLYYMVHRNQHFKTYLLSRSDLESLVSIQAVQHSLIVKHSSQSLIVKV